MPKTKGGPFGGGPVICPINPAWLLRCDKCGVRLATSTVVGTFESTRLCVSCLDDWHVWRNLIYRRDDGRS